MLRRHLRIFVGVGLAEPVGVGFVVGLGVDYGVVGNGEVVSGEGEGVWVGEVFWIRSLLGRSRL